MLIMILTFTSLALGSGAGESATDTDKALLKKARQIMKEVPLIDGHNDTAWQYRNRVNNHLDAIDFAGDTGQLERPMHTDLPRLRAGRVGGQFWSVWVPVELPGADAVQATLEQIDVVHRLVTRYSDDLELALTADDIVRIHGQGKIASLIDVEGGHSINNSLAVLRQFYRAGARCMTITHWNNIAWADAATDTPEHGGLTPFGKEVIREMNRLGMLVDLSHVSPGTMNDALDVSKAPIIFSHSSARAICDHPRNVPDDVLSRMKKNDGVVMVTFALDFVSEEVRQYKGRWTAEEARLKDLLPHDPDAVEAGIASWREAHPLPSVPLAEVADHIDHIRKVAGIDHVGIGSDFDGISAAPVGLEDVSAFPALLAELLKRGYSEEEVKQVAGQNLLRVMRRAEKVAAELRRKTTPSDALIEELDKELKK
ncbi:MAG: dipeptidase [Fidelibacterota bacterium]|nr:MAG: dipeptidase [Candidatus Neomarinimicrobiota bacterium]